jgi:small subunit ribosomal protein S16
MIVLRLTRVGKKKQPTYRIIVQEQARDPWGKAIEILGHYNPRANPKQLTVKEDRVKYWMSKGAQPSVTLHNLLVKSNLITASKKRASSGDKKKKEEKK